MSKSEAVSVKDTVYKLQLSLLQGIKNEDQLFTAGSVISRSDYEDIVIERSISNLCGYPLCNNALPSDRSHKGRYRISLKEHKVYDLQETYMFCSSTCLVNSRTFSGSLQEERCSVLNPVKLNEILRRFDDLNFDSDALGENGDLGLSDLKIQEKIENNVGISLDEWIGQSNAIEGYVPQRDRSSKISSRDRNEGSKAISAKEVSKQDSFFGDMDFTSTIITSDEYNISKAPSVSTSNTVCDSKVQAKKRKGNHKSLKGQLSSPQMQDSLEGSRKTNNAKAVSNRDSSFNDMDFCSTIITDSEYSISKAPSGVRSSRVCDSNIQENMEKKNHKSLEGQLSSLEKQDSLKGSKKTKVRSKSQDLPSSSNYTPNVEEISESMKAVSLSESILKPSLKPSGSKKSNHSVTWADEKIDKDGSRNLCEFQNIEERKQIEDISESLELGDENNIMRFESAEACALALSQAAEAVLSGDADMNTAMSDAGIIVLPLPHDVDQKENMENTDMVDEESASVKWPTKPGVPESEYFDPEDSWFDAPPEEFSLALSPFATMWMALFAWVSSSSLAYIYGADESAHEDYLSVNEREYPRKIVLRDGRSSEIRVAVESYLARALPALVADLRLPIPISTLEQGVGHLLDTMSFVDAVPAFRMKQWQLIALLFIEALSVCRIDALGPYMTNRRALLPQVLASAHISAEEYNVMKDLLIPLDRNPQSRSGA